MVVTLTAALTSVTEGGSVVYTASVDNTVTGSDLVVTLSENATITIPVGSSGRQRRAGDEGGDAGRRPRHNRGFLKAETRKHQLDRRRQPEARRR